MNSRDVDRYQRNYLGLPFEQYVEQVRRSYVHAFLEDMFPTGELRLLEIGAGRQSIFESLSDRWCGAIIDPDHAFLERAEKALSPDRCTFIQGFFEDFETDTKYDVAIASSVLHEVRDDEHFLQQAKRCLSSSGFLIIVVPNAMSIHRLVGTEMGLIKDPTELSATNIQMQQHRVYTFSALRSTLERCGFEPIYFDGFFPKILDHKSMADALAASEINLEFLQQLNALSHRIPAVSSEIFAVARTTCQK